MTGRTRVLFVDDEPLVLDGLKRLLRNMRSEWDMVFVESAARGLETLASEPFDVVVTDMRMPGMNGAEFLAKVKEGFPSTIRIVLSGHADQELILLAEESAHQFLAKPCDPDLLRVVIQRASEVGNRLPGLEIRKILGGISHIPVLPASYLEIRKVLESETTTLDDLGAIVKRDPGMTANVLKLVNSAYFGLRQRVSSPSEAVSYLGVETLKAVALLNGIFDQIKALPAEFNLSILWDHCLRMAVLSKEIARLEGLDKEGVSDSFTGGLLHDIGMLILASGSPERYIQAARILAQEPVGVPEAETRVFGAHHGEVGGYLLGLWGLPAAVVEAVAQHHEPFTMPMGAPTPAIIVQAAEILVTPQGDCRCLGIPRDPAISSQADLMGPRWESWLEAASHITATEAGHET